GTWKRQPQDAAAVKELAAAPARPPSAAADDMDPAAVLPAPRGSVALAGGKSMPSYAPAARFRSLRAPASPGVQAGSSDDNLQFNAYLRFIADNGRLGLPHDVTRRIVIEVRDSQGLPIQGASVSVRDAKGAVVARRATYA